MPKLIGLEIILKCIDYRNPPTEINVEEILIQKYNFTAERTESGENFMEGMVLPQVIQIKDHNTRVAVDLGREVGAYGADLGFGYIATNLIAHTDTGDLRVKQGLKAAGTENVGIHIQDTFDLVLQKPGTEYPQYGAECPTAHLEIKGKAVALNLNALIQSHQKIDILLLQLRADA